MKPNIDDIRDRLLEFCNIFAFEYAGHNYGVDPFNPTFFHLCCDGTILAVDSIDAVFSTPFFDGRTLPDIFDDIDIIEW